MTTNNYQRREFLKTTSLGLAAAALPLRTAEAKSAKRAFTFAQISDTQLGFGGYELDLQKFRQAVKQINALQPDFVVICGDLVDTPSEKSFADFLKIKDEFEIPSYCAAGNHDIGNIPTKQSLQKYREIVGDDYYAFDHGGYSFVTVNTQLWKWPLAGESHKQDTWFDITLQVAALKKSPVFLIGHYPLYLKNPTEEEDYYNLPVEKRQKLLSMFLKHGVVAMLGGHTHKLIINEHQGIQLVNAETTSKNFDQRPFGFRLWTVAEMRPFECEFVALEGFS